MCHLVSWSVVRNNKVEYGAVWIVAVNPSHCRRPFLRCRSDKRFSTRSLEKEEAAITRHGGERVYVSVFGRDRQRDLPSKRVWICGELLGANMSELMVWW